MFLFIACVIPKVIVYKFYGDLCISIRPMQNIYAGTQFYFQKNKLLHKDFGYACLTCLFPTQRHDTFCDELCGIIGLGEAKVPTYLCNVEYNTNCNANINQVWNFKAPHQKPERTLKCFSIFA